MTAPTHSEDVGGVEELAPVVGSVAGVYRNVADLPDAALDRMAENLESRPRIAWKGRALVAQAALEYAMATVHFWRSVAIYLAITLALCVAALAVAVGK